MEYNIDSFFNKNAINKQSIDRITDIAFLAQQYAKQHGKNKTIDGSIGIFKYDNENLLIFPIIEHFIQSLPITSYSSYGPMKASKKFENGIIALYGFEKYKDQMSIHPVSGGLNGLHHAVHNFVDHNTFCTSLFPYWGPYENILQELGYDLHGISLFDENNMLSIDISIIEKKLTTISQEKVFFILNTPAQNPTGLSFNEDEIVQLASIIKKIKLSGKQILVFLDSVYIHFTPFTMESILDALIDIAPILVNTSISKTLALYGFRAGGLCLLSKNKNDHDKFIKKMIFSSRASLGSINHLAYSVIEFCSDISIENDIKPLQKEVQVIMQNRANLFLNVLKKYNFKHYRYDYGFFITLIPPDNLSIKGFEKFENILFDNGIFFIPMENCFRAGICSLSVDKIEMLDEKLKDIM